MARWSALHAVVLLAGTAIALWMQSLIPIVAVGACSFIGFVIAFRGHWTPRGSFGTANAITALRLSGLLLLAGWPWTPGTAQPLLATLAAGLLLLDGLDGWAARITKQSSDFGAFFDKEVDAFALLLLCLLAIIQQGVFAALLVAGLLRYLFALLMYVSDPPAHAEPRTPTARYLYVFMMAAILLPFLPLPGWTEVVLWGAVAGLVASFVPYFVWALRGNPIVFKLRSS